MNIIKKEILDDYIKKSNSYYEILFRLNQAGYKNEMDYENKLKLH